MPRRTAAKYGWPLMVAVLLAATVLRTIPLLDNRFHPDEALYGSFARRIASGQDPMLTGVLVDKPPVSFYLTALSLRLVEGGELGARLPSLYASVVSVALLFVLARRLYARGTAYAAAGLLALSPLAVLFSITVFLDPLLTAAVLWALCAAARGQWRGLAAALAVAFAIKQTALIFVPLALALAWLRLPARATPRQAMAYLWPAVRWLVPALALTAVAIFAWDAAREPPIGFWSQGYADNMPGRLVRANEVQPRALAWINLLHYGTAASVLNGAAVMGWAGLLATGARKSSRAALADGMLSVFALLYLGAYWLLAFNVWDRYLVPLLPVLCVLMARGLGWLGGFVVAGGGRERRSPTSPSPASVALGEGCLVGQVAGMAGLRGGERGLDFRPVQVGALAVGIWLGLSLLPGAVTAARSGYPVGGDHGAYDGVDDAALYLSSLPEGSVLYDRWLSWQWNFYLFDAPVYVAWMPSPEGLATDLAAFGQGSPRYFVVPSWEPDGEMRAAAARAGFEFVPRHRSYRRDGSLSLTVYELTPASPDATQGAAPEHDQP